MLQTYVGLGSSGPDARHRPSRMEAQRPHMRDASLLASGGMAGEASPESLRSAMAEYVAAVHRAYLDASESLSPGERARLPLVSAGRFTVVAVGTRYLHVIATVDHLPPPAGPEVELHGAEGDLSWTLRFFDPVVVPALGLVDESESPAGPQIRDLLGLSRVVYHLTVPPGGGLTPHHALHSGTGLAHSHAAASRDYDAIAALLPHRTVLVSEMRAAEAAEMHASVVLLARYLQPDVPAIQELDPSTTDSVEARRQLLAHLRSGR